METVKIDLIQCSPTAMSLVDESQKVIVDRPLEKGGGGKGLMGGKYLLTGIAGCFCSTFLAASQSRNIVFTGLNVKVLAQISEDLPKRFTAIILTVSYDKCSDASQFPKLLHMAEKGCLSVNTIKQGMAFTVERG